MRVFKRFDPEVKKILKSGGVGVIPTDTIYGVSALAFSPQAVNRIYRVKKRSPHSKFIILISKISDLKKFGITPDDEMLAILKKYWPGKLSVELPCPHRNVLYLHRGTHTISFRLPAVPALRKLVQEVGPLVSTSANISGKPSAKNIAEAQAYFKKKVDFYVDWGTIKGAPSTLIGFQKGKLVVFRKGAVRIKNG